MSPLFAQPNAEQLDSATFSRLRRLYVLALGAIALAIVSGQLLIQDHLRKQTDDSRVVNVAGRQRMLSQRITKQVLLLNTDATPDSLRSLRQQLRKDLWVWQQAHLGLQGGSSKLGLPGQNSPAIRDMFQRVNPHFEAIYRAALQIANASADGVVQPDSQLLTQIMRNEKRFVAEMDQIVFQYDAESKAKVNEIKRIEWVLLVIALTILLIEFWFIFRPAAIHVRNTLQRLMHSEQEAKRMAKEMEQLYRAKESSLQELKALTFAVDQAALFANCTTNGQLRYLSEKFRELLGYDNKPLRGRLAEIICADEPGQRSIEETMQKARSRISTNEIQISTPDGRKLWLEMSVIPVSGGGLAQDLLILCADITYRKEAQLEIERLNQERFDEQMRQQVLRSAQIVEAQEEERKRIARDIHDGIGQMLTALKFNLDSLDPQQPDKVQAKLEKLQGLTAKLIQGVRMVTFNLTPPELSDYGIATGLARMAAELSKLTNRNILFENSSNFNERLDTVVETNLYRITQEAVNNAVKYAQSNFILIRISHSEKMLSIVIDDDGVGFDPEEVSDKQDGSGMGLSFMRERMQFIEGRMFIHSEIGEGTRITLNVPLTT